jgi:GT2 family glycosyltransferase
VIGAKLLYPGGDIQHAGVAICADRRPRHIYRGFPAAHPAVCRSRRFQVVTGACMLVRRSLFNHLGGFDVAFLNGFEDVDLCLRAGAAGAQVHYCAECVLNHLEGATRQGRSPENHNLALYEQRWAHRVEPDEFTYYAADRLLSARQTARYPLQFSIRPELGWVGAPPPANGHGAPRPEHANGARPAHVPAVRPRPAPPPAR